MRATRASESVRLVIRVLQKEGSVLLVRQHDATYIRGEWGLPPRILLEGAASQEIAQDLTRRLMRASIQLESCAPVRHSLTFRRIVIHVFYGELTGPVQELENARWDSPQDLDSDVTFSAFRKAVRSAFE